MKTSILPLAFLVLSQVVSSQVLPATTLDQFWPDGQERKYRLWYADTLEVGLYKAVLTGVTRENGAAGFVLRDESSILMESDSTQNKQEYATEIKLDSLGHFLSGESRLRIGARREKITISYDSAAGLITGRWGEGKSATAREVAAPASVFACDLNMISQIEIMLAGYDLDSGRSIIIPAVSPQRLFVTDFEFHVMARRLIQYGHYVDSVWQVELVRPGRQTLFIDRMHRLVKLLDYDQKIMAVLDRDPFAERPLQKRTTGDFLTNQISRLPIYGLILAVTGVWLAFLGREGWSYRGFWLLWMTGGLSYAVVFLAQAPLQELYGMAVLYPAIREGRNIIPYGFIPSLISALVQPTLKIIPLLVLVALRRPQPLILTALGAFVGAGFGFAEAGYVLGPLFQNHALGTLAISERVFSTLFHAATGGLLGYGLTRYKTFRFWTAVAILHFLLAYSLFFHKLVSFGLLHAFQIVVSLAAAAVLIFLQRSYRHKILAGVKGKA